MLIALDVGFTKMGWCIFHGGKPVKFGIIKTEVDKRKQVRVSDDRAYRSAYMAKQLHNIIQENGVEAAVGELPAGGALSAIAMSYMMAGTALAAATLEIMGIPVEWTTPTAVKMAAAGAKNASKDEVMASIREKFPDTEWPSKKAQFEDVADAVGAYLASKSGTLVKVYG